ncbi:unnamed protein product [Adineta steineri]|uniref:JmjC domain-containing protein n=1 Tax=Adineta steineri TaxID=433720 RepID=A0A814Y274_9BILA|nr:unnamed protein product [Adineta steineri]
MSSIAKIPSIPILTPSIVEFKNLLSYLYDNEALITSYGACKIIPPREWTKVKELSLASVTDVPLLNRQSIIKLSPLVSRITNSQRKTARQETQLKHFVDFAQRPKNRVSYDITDIESKFWSMINSNDITKCVILDATNIDYSLFALTEKTFNLNDIPLKSLLSITTQRIKGVTSPFLHVGMFSSMFALHTEEGDLFSMSYMHEGASKFWYIVPSSHADQLEQCLANVDILDRSRCHAPMRHKNLFPNPIELIQSHNIPVYRIEQCPNEIVVTCPRVYHWGFNGGLNIAESVNFALPSWIPFGWSARSCTCQRQDHSVEIDMTPFNEESVNKYTQTHLNSLLLLLDDMIATPFDKQPMLYSGLF